MSEPREFWIIREKGYSTWVSEKPLYSADTSEEINVIEKSAYDALKAENKVMREALEIYTMTNETFPEYGDVARSTLAKLKESV